MKDPVQDIHIRGVDKLADAIKTFGYCIVAATVIPTIITISYLEGLN